MRKLIAFVMLLCATMFPANAITSAHELSKDGYYYEQSTFTRLELRVIIYPVPDLVMLTKLYELHYPDQPFPEGKVVKGFTLLNPNTNMCEIYIIDPTKLYEPEYLGHEMMHCVYGYFHPHQK
jgi:hypothetical protein